MGKIWVDIVPTVSADGDEAKSALTKQVKDKIHKAMTENVVAGLPSNFSEKDADKPKDKRDDYAPRAVRLDVGLKMTLETKGPKVATGGKGTVTLEMLKLKSANESGEFVAQLSAKVSGVEKRGALDDVLDKLTEHLLKEIDFGGLAKKMLSSSEFKKLAEQRNMQLE